MYGWACIWPVTLVIPTPPPPPSIAYPSTSDGAKVFGFVQDNHSVGLYVSFSSISVFVQRLSMMIPLSLWIQCIHKFTQCVFSLVSVRHESSKELTDSLLHGRSSLLWKLRLCKRHVLMFYGRETHSLVKSSAMLWRETTLVLYRLVAVCFISHSMKKRRKTRERYMYKKILI